MRGLILVTVLATGVAPEAAAGPAAGGSIAVHCRAAGSVETGLAATLCSAFADGLAARFPGTPFHRSMQLMPEPTDETWVSMDLLSAGASGAEVRMSYRTPATGTVVVPDQGIRVTDAVADAARLAAFVQRAIERSQMPFQ